MRPQRASRAGITTAQRDIVMTKLIALSIGLAFLTSVTVTAASAKTAKAHHHSHHKAGKSSK
jgi:hypothetical protein